MNRKIIALAVLGIFLLSGLLSTSVVGINIQKDSKKVDKALYKDSGPLDGDLVVFLNKIWVEYDKDTQLIKIRFEIINNEIALPPFGVCEYLKGDIVARVSLENGLNELSENIIMQEDGKWFPTMVGGNPPVVVTEFARKDFKLNFDAPLSGWSDEIFTISVEVNPNRHIKEDNYRNNFESRNFNSSNPDVVDSEPVCKSISRLKTTRLANMIERLQMRLPILSRLVNLL